MSQVTMCDLCGVTSRGSAGTEMTALQLPHTVMPDALEEVARKPSGGTCAIDICPACVEATRAALDRLLTERLSAGGTPTTSIEERPA